MRQLRRGHRASEALGCSNWFPCCVFLIQFSLSFSPCCFFFPSFLRTFRRFGDECSGSPSLSSEPLQEWAPHTHSCIETSSLIGYSQRLSRNYCYSRQGSSPPPTTTWGRGTIWDPSKDHLESRAPRGIGRVLCYKLITNKVLSLSLAFHRCDCQGTSL